jgi:hypothetical protein
MAEALPGRRVPGWYRDPDDPDRLRYWSGSGWTARRRPRPVWAEASAEWIVAAPAEAEAVAYADPDGTGEPTDGGRSGPVLEGPVRPAELPAIAAAVTGPAERSPGRKGPAAALGGGRGSNVSTRRPGLGTGPYSSWPHPWLRRRGPARVVGMVAVIAMIAMIVAVGVVQPSGTAEWMLTDQSFVSRANALCQKSMPGATGASTQPGMTAATGGTQVATAPSDPSQVVATAGAVDALANKLAALPVAAADQAHVRMWLASWHSWAYDQRLYAAAVSAHPSSAQPSDATQAQTMAQAEEDAADHFATVNGLLSCNLAATAPGAQPFG